MSHAKVLVVDDSAVVRGLISRMLREDPEIDVPAMAPNGQKAIELCAKHNPHVVVLDVEMPVMDGLEALQVIRKSYPAIKVIMCSSLTQRNAEITMKALSLGAVDAIEKPSSTGEMGATGSFKRRLTDLIKIVSRAARLSEATTSQATSDEQEDASKKEQDTSISYHDESKVTLRNEPLISWRPKVLVIGSSTGGPQALFNVLKSIAKVKNIPIFITQHMPPTFTTTLAQHITQQTGLTCYEGADGMYVERGFAYLAPGGFHMTVDGDQDTMKISLNKGEPEHFCRPSVEPMFRSVMDIFGEKSVLGVILTGMGSDGVNASGRLVNKGGHLISQDRSSSVVWGMPGAVATRGYCCGVMPIDKIGPWVAQRVC